MAVHVYNTDYFLKHLRDSVSICAGALSPFVDLTDITVKSIKFNLDYNSLTRQEKVDLLRQIEVLERINVGLQSLFEYFYDLIQKPIIDKKLKDYEQKISL